VDADVLLRPKAIQTLLAFAKRQEPRVFEVQGFVYDKFFDGSRQAGNHLYRTELLEKAIAHIPHNGSKIRPEAHVLNTMQSLGYPRMTLNRVLGLHDFEQYFSDIYRKAFIQSYKHLNYAEKMIRAWREYAQNDQDFEIALQAFADGIRNSEEVRVDNTYSLFGDMFNKLQVNEKKELDLSRFTALSIETMYRDITGANYKPLDPSDLQASSPSARMGSVKERLDKLGVLKTVVLYIGITLLKAGNKMKSSVEE
jgi:hypothetical protein